jgi:hypothetical protein
MRPSLIALSLPLALALSACPGSLEDPERFTAIMMPEDCDAPAMIFEMRCATSSSCHGVGSSIYEITGPSFPASLVDVPAPTCTDYDYIDTDSPDDSFILRKVAEEMPGCGTPRMPLGGPYLAEDEIECVRGWLHNLEVAAPSDAGEPTDGGSETDAGPADGGA